MAKEHRCLQERSDERELVCPSLTSHQGPPEVGGKAREQRLHAEERGLGEPEGTASQGRGRCSQQLSDKHFAGHGERERSPRRRRSGSRSSLKIYQSDSIETVDSGSTCQSRSRRTWVGAACTEFSYYCTAQKPLQLQDNSGFPGRLSHLLYTLYHLCRFSCLHMFFSTLFVQLCHKSLHAPLPFVSTYIYICLAVFHIVKMLQNPYVFLVLRLV
nr:uncharacterized protein LOC110360391 [Columba livia]